MRTVHLTCFDAFGALRENPTRWLVAALPEISGWRTVKTVLPTSYARVGTKVDGIFDQRLEAVVMFGYTSQTDRLRLEHVARNRDRSPRPDNDGRLGRPVILPGAPPAYSSTVDLAPMLSALCARKAPFTYSTDAGGYVCNHSYFLALDRARSIQPAVPCLFVHIPLPRTSAKRSEIRRAACVVLACVLRAAWGEGPARRPPPSPARKRHRASA
jgi:pyroglutamyl-peptidase